MTPIMVALFYSSAFGLAGASRPVHCVVHGFQWARIPESQFMNPL